MTIAVVGVALACCATTSFAPPSVNLENAMVAGGSNRLIGARCMHDEHLDSAGNPVPRRVPGTASDMDVNVFRGGEGELRRLSQRRLGAPGPRDTSAGAAGEAEHAPTRLEKPPRGYCGTKEWPKMQVKLSNRAEPPPPVTRTDRECRRDGG